MDRDYCIRESDFYLRELLENVLPFWLSHAVDEECGGYFQCLRRDGSVYDEDKVSTWALGRIAWSFGYLYNNLQPNPAWLDMAMRGVRFIEQFGLDATGRLYGALTRDGRPLGPATDIYHDLFAASALAECYRATGQAAMLDRANQLTVGIWRLLERPQDSPYRPYFGQVRALSNHPEYLILLETVQMLRPLADDPRYDEIAAWCVERILSLHYSEQDRAVFEWVRTDGHPLPRWLGRWVCPGHMLELVWIFIREGQYRRDDRLVDIAIKVADWAMAWGWDKRYGGIPNDINIDGEYCLGPHITAYAPFVLWWQMLEAIHANLLVYCLTRESRFLERYETARDWSFRYFPDREYGEWYGILSREGQVIDGGVKGSDVKQCQHIVRTFFHCHRLMAEQSQTPVQDHT